MCFPNAFFLKQILLGLVKVRVPHNSFYREGQFHRLLFGVCACIKLTCGYSFSSRFVSVFMELVEEKSRHCLHNNMHLISTPLQVIWGKQDQVRLDNYITTPCPNIYKPEGIYRIQSLRSQSRECFT